MTSAATTDYGRLHLRKTAFRCLRRQDSRMEGPEFMQKIALGTSGRDTTRLGFGCSSLLGSLGRKDSLALLETAYDAGLRHFDVAPAYGYGQAEGCLGEFLTRHRGEVTVTTKYGVEPEGERTLKAGMRSLARPLLKLMPGIKGTLQKAAAASTATPAPRAHLSCRQSPGIAREEPA